MNNKGFTLIELLATVALLSVIVTISFISINSMIKQNKVNNCETIVNNLKSATKEYVSDNRYKRDFTREVVSNKVNINASLLIGGNYLSSPIIDPFDSGHEINADSIEIIITLNNDYTVKEVSVNGIECNKND